MKRRLELMVCVFLAIVAMVSSSSAADLPPVMVGRIYHIEGSLLRYVTAENDWVAAVRDAPFGTGDTFYTGENGMAELIVPNGTWIRIGDNTQIQFITLDTDLAEIDVASGVTRFYNKSSDMVIKATSPFGYVLVYPGGVFDYYVGESSAEVVAVRGKISFVHTETNARYEVSAGDPSILADQTQVTSGDGSVDPAWDGWNKSRESFWVSKGRTMGQSVRYLPVALHHDAYVFEENGRWERVYYDGRDCWFWRPTRVSSRWAPFTEGRWTEWDGDQTWIPAEPFGYATHHYGNWIYTRNRWYWAPPVVTVTVGLPLLNISFFWNPGRVSWIHSGQNVGWVPLAPRETYYSHRNWGGPHDMVVTNANRSQININLRNYAYAKHAVVIPQRSYSTVNNYRSVRVANINNTTIINNYRAAPVVNDTVVSKYSANKQRYDFANVQVKEKPHTIVNKRINDNQKIIQQGRKEKASVIEKQVKAIQEGKINREARIQQPKTTNYIVPASQVNRPKSEIKLQQKEIKGAGKGVQPGKPAQVLVPKYVAPARPGQTKQVVVPQHIAPAQTEGRNQAVVPEHVAPARPGQKGKVTIPEHAMPVKAGQKELPGQVVVPRHAAPAQPGQPPTVVIPEHVLPARTSQPGSSGQVVVPKHVAPARPGQAKQVVVPQHVAPAQPEGPNQVVVPEHVAPARQGQTGKVVIPEHAKPVKLDRKELPGQAVVPRYVAPAQTDQPRKVVIPQHVTPVKPVQQPERVTPPKPSPPGPPAQVVVPQPAPPVKPVQQPERVAPPKPSPPGPPAQVVVPLPAPPAPKQERVAPAAPEIKEKTEKPASAKDEEPAQPDKKPVQEAPAKVRPQDKQKGEPDGEKKQR